ncbi:MAG: hypothetical protein ACI9H6_000800 [Patiriisocius sp.]|jgi:hypothetical protein
MSQTLKRMQTVPVGALETQKLDIALGAHWQHRIIAPVSNKKRPA